MRERHPDFLAPRDDDAVRVEQPKPGELTFCVATRSGIMRAPRATKAGSAGAGGMRAPGLGGSTLSLASSSAGQIG